MQHLASNKRSFANKIPSTMDLEVHRLRPKLFVQDRERLFDDAMKQKMTANFLKDENVRLKTRIHVLESEVGKKEKIIDELLLQQDSYQLGGVGGPMIFNPKSAKARVESHLAMNLKRKVREQQMTIAQKQEELEQLRRNIRSTKLSEMEAELKMYADECQRLRAQLEELVRSRDSFADPDQMNAIEQRFQQQEMLLAQLRNENTTLAMAFSSKDQECAQAREALADTEKKLKAAK